MITRPFNTTNTTFSNEDLERATNQAIQYIRTTAPSIVSDAHDTGDILTLVQLAQLAITRDAPAPDHYTAEHAVDRLAMFQSAKLKQADEQNSPNLKRDTGIAVWQLASALGLQNQLHVRLAQHAPSGNKKSP